MKKIIAVVALALVTASCGWLPAKLSHQPVITPPGIVKVRP